MFSINEDLSIYATRGDIVFFAVAAEDEGTAYKFQPGDVVRIKVYGKKDAGTVVLEKCFPVTEETEEVEIFLTKEDTKIGEVISKPKDYWYEVELNPFDHPQTIIGYDEDGAKVFKMFPEGADIESYEPEPEDFPVVDTSLDLSSPRPVENRAVAREIVQLNGDMDTIWDKIYPIGSVYMSVNPTDPGELFGGKWERIKDRFLLAAGDTYDAGATGGEAEHTLAEHEMPDHTHQIYDTMIEQTNLGVEWGNYAGTERGYGITINGTMKTREAGDGNPHNNMPPYLAVYMWKRIPERR